MTSGPCRRETCTKTRAPYIVRPFNPAINASPPIRFSALCRSEPPKHVAEAGINVLRPGLLRILAGGRSGVNSGRADEPRPKIRPHPTAEGFWSRNVGSLAFVMSDSPARAPAMLIHHRRLPSPPAHPRGSFVVFASKSGMRVGGGLVYNAYVGGCIRAVWGMRGG